MLMENRNTTTLLPGFQDPVLDSQYTFRRVLDAMAHPGATVVVGQELKVPWPLNRATAAVCLSLLDYETPVWMDCAGNPDIADWLTFHCGCPLTDAPGQARFAVFCNKVTTPVLEQFNIGQDEFPENSTTLILQVSSFEAGRIRQLRGPGIESVAQLSIPDLTEAFWSYWDQNHRLFPLGLDVLFTSDTILAALPRSVKAGV